MIKISNSSSWASLQLSSGKVDSCDKVSTRVTHSVLLYFINLPSLLPTMANILEKI